MATQQNKYYKVVDEGGKIRTKTRCLASAKELARYWENRTMIKMSVESSNNMETLNTQKNN